MITTNYNFYFSGSVSEPAKFNLILINGQYSDIIEQNISYSRAKYLQQQLEDNGINKGKLIIKKT